MVKTIASAQPTGRCDELAKRFNNCAELRSDRANCRNHPRACAPSETPQPVGRDEGFGTLFRTSSASMIGNFIGFQDRPDGAASVLEISLEDDGEGLVILSGFSGRFRDCWS